MENAADADEEMDDEWSENDGHAGDTTFATPRVRIANTAADNDAEMEDASDSERENTCGFQTPLPPWRGSRHGKKMVSNLTLEGGRSVSTSDPRKNAQGGRLKIDTTSPPERF